MIDNWIIKQKIAHRGLHTKEYPENSLGAFSNAINHNFAIELDVQKISDGTIVVFHDENLLRLCDIDLEVSKLKSEDLNAHKLLGSKYTIPTLIDVLKLVDGKTPIIIELKSPKLFRKIAPDVFSLIKDYKGDIAVKSFNPLEIKWFRKHAPHILRGLLASSLQNSKLPRIYKRLIRNLFFLKTTKPDFISYGFRDLPNKYVSKSGVPVITWTITSEEMEKQALTLAQNVIFENYTPDKSHIGV